MSRAAASASADAFSQLRGMNSGRDDDDRRPVVIDGAANSVLEAIVKEALKPILKDWLDQHLPQIVEDMVRAEIQRVAQSPGGTRRR